MSIIKLSYLYCDGENCQHRDGTGQEPFNIDPMPGDTASDIRAGAKEIGWVRRKGKDYCPYCATSEPSGDRQGGA